MYTIQEPNKKEIAFTVLSNDWPQTYDMDHSQIDAYTLALTREFAVIQGPPGTGKTFIGIKIATTLLKNLSLEETPMLIICYTNHALDQFLEGVLEVTNNIVRLGSQSKSKILEPYNLNSMRGRIKSRYSYLYGSKRSELEKIVKCMSEIQTEIEKCEKEVLTYKSVKKYLKGNELKSNKEDPILPWLFDHEEDELDKLLQDDEESEDWEKVLETEDEDLKLETCFSEEWALREIDSMYNSIKYVNDVNDDQYEGEKMTDRFETQIRKVRRRMNFFKVFNFSIIF